MAKRRSDERDGGRIAKRRLQHLYLVFDDWSSGYSIRKVDPCDANPPSDSDSDDDSSEPRLPPAVLRVPAARGLPQYFAAAFGSRIMALQPREKRGADGERHLAPKDLVPSSTLFALGAKSFDQLWPPPLEHPGGEHHVWSWYQCPARPSRGGTSPPTRCTDGQTVLVSTERQGGAATFAFDTEADDMEWALPFDGRAHFDADLDAFVGLSRDPDTPGHLCSCDAAPPGNDYMGRRSKFCLVQCVSMEDGCIDEELAEEEEGVPRPRRHMLRLTTFSLGYDKNGDLTTGKSCRVRYCEVPKSSTETLLKNPVAFWL
ncbi:hypothetical protein PR202_ga13427 [Eleusine coracana subsp. coracana]|uniref:DUF1618 domain-containing protein n=1 Tax=Eleusine coracana subsp. coracana TaxID=191504 RepID=A0AAV5CEP1_ELECO|nr:hypothetical protein PR202_ga13427 [Eleusine coracana subsp. coracana]